MSAYNYISIFKIVSLYIYIIINVIADYSFADFKWLFLYIYKNNIKNLTIYRYNELVGAILLMKEEKPKITKITKKNNTNINNNKSLKKIIDKIYI